MLLRGLALSVSVAAISMTAACMGAYQEAPYPPPPPPRYLPPSPPPQAHADVKPKPSPVTTDNKAAREPAKEDKASEEKPKKTAEASESKPSDKPAKAARSGPLTPADIRSAVPAQKVADPKGSLAGAPVRSLWGDSLGRVQSVDMDGGKLAGVKVSISGGGGGKSKTVRIDTGRLKYVPSRHVLITSLSRGDLEKLPAQNP